MSLSKIALVVVFIFLISASYLGWFAVGGDVIGWIGIAFVVLVLLESIGVIAISIPVDRVRATHQE